MKDGPRGHAREGCRFDQCHSLVLGQRLATRRESNKERRPLALTRSAPTNTVRDQALIRMSTPAGMLSEESESTVWGVGSEM